MNENLSQLEDKIHSRTKNPKRPLTAVFVVFGIGLALLATGIFLRNGNISADVASDTPPVPSGPESNITPVVPANPGSNTNASDLNFPAGWSMIAGSIIEGYSLSSLKDAGVYLYSFNDPAYPVTKWVTYPTGAIVPIAPLGYYIFNPTGKSQKISLKDKITPAGETIFGRGWHLIFWPGDSVSYNELVSSVSLVYSVDTNMALADAMSATNHRTSAKVYVVTNEYSLETGSVKELTTSDSATAISKIPKNSYFWIYLRRTKDRVVEITMAASTGAGEKTKIDAWLKANNLTDCGDAQGTMYAGGNCLFDESTGKNRDKYEYLVKKFPDKPWSKNS